MSVLEVFVRARQYKERAAEYFELAAQPFSEEVRARYLAIADHYMALAEGEIRTDRLMRQKRLEQMRAEREKSQRTDAAPANLKADQPPARRAQEPAKLRLVEGVKRPQQRGNSGGHSGPAQMAAQSVFTIVKTAW